MTDKDVLSIGFQIKTIELMDTCLNAPQEPLAAETVFQFEINLEHRINVEKDFVIVICTVSIQNETKDHLFGKLRSSCVYEVKELSKIVDPETKSVAIPEVFATTLNAVSLSTTRGLMFSYFRGTFLHNAILPIIDPKSFSSEKK